MTTWTEYIKNIDSSHYQDSPTYSSVSVGTGFTLNGNIRQSRGTIASSNYVANSAGYSLDSENGQINVQHVVSSGGLTGSVISGGELTIGEHFFVDPSTTSATDYAVGVGTTIGGVVRAQSSDEKYTISGANKTTGAVGAASLGTPFQIRNDGTLLIKNNISGGAALDPRLILQSTNYQGTELSAGSGPSIDMYVPTDDGLLTSLGGRIGAEKEDDADNNEATSLTFYTAANSASPTKAFTIASDNSATLVGALTTAGLTMDSVALTTVQTGGETFADNDTSLMTSAAIQDKILSYSYITGVTDIAGNAATATALETARNIGGVSFNGTGNIDLAGVNTAGNQNTSGNAATATALATARAINGVDFDGTAAITVTADANTLSGTTLKSTVVNSSLTSVGTLTHDLTIGDTLILTGDDVSHISNNTTSGREILQLRGKTANSNGAGINLYGDGDSSNAGKTIFFNNNGTSMVIDTDKQVTKPSLCAFRVCTNTASGGYLYGRTSSTGPIVFTTDSYAGSGSGSQGLYDNGNNYNTSTGYFTAPVDGYYYFGFSLFTYTTYDTDSNIYVRITSSDGSATTVNRGKKGESGGFTIQGVFHLDANDTVSVNVVGGPTAADGTRGIYTWRTQHYNSFQGHLIG